MSSIETKSGSSNRLSDVNPQTPRPLSVWEEASNTHSHLLDELYNSVQSLFEKFEPVLEPERVTDGGSDEKAQENSRVVQHLLYSSERVRQVIERIRILKERSQI